MQPCRYIPNKLLQYEYPGSYQVSNPKPVAKDSNLLMHADIEEVEAAPAGYQLPAESTSSDEDNQREPGGYQLEEVYTSSDEDYQAEIRYTVDDGSTCGADTATSSHQLQSPLQSGQQGAQVQSVGHQCQDGQQHDEAFQSGNLSSFIHSAHGCAESRLDVQGAKQPPNRGDAALHAARSDTDVQSGSRVEHEDTPQQEFDWASERR